MPVASLLLGLRAVSGAGDRSWTHDILITSEALYQLSYTGKGRNCRESIRWKQYDLGQI